MPLGFGDLGAKTHPSPGGLSSNGSFGVVSCSQSAEQITSYSAGATLAAAVGGLSGQPA